MERDKLSDFLWYYFLVKLSFFSFLPTKLARTTFWFLVCYASTQLAIQSHQERIQVVRSNRVAWKRPAESNGIPTMDLGFEDIRKRKYTNKRGINKIHIHKHATCRNSTYTKKELMLHCILLLYCCVCTFHCVCDESGLLSCGWFVWLVIIIYYIYVHIYIYIYIALTTNMKMSKSWDPEAEAGGRRCCPCPLYLHTLHYYRGSRGVMNLEDIKGFDKRFGDGTHITEFRHGHGRQPCGYTQVCCVSFVLGALVCDFWLRVFSKKL